MTNREAQAEPGPTMVCDMFGIVGIPAERKERAVTQRQNLGEFEHLLLLAALRLGEGAYGVAIKKEIESRTGRSVTLGAVYPTMDRLEARGFVSSQLGTPTAERGGRARRLFSVTAVGAEALEKAYHVFASMWEGLDPSQLRTRK